MYFETYNALLYSDTMLPDIFITEYMPSMEGDFIKVYTYSLFLSKRNKQATVDELSKVLCMDINKVKDALSYFESLGIAQRKDNNVILTDLKEREIKKIFRMKSTSTPEEAIQSTERNKRRNNLIKTINETFFQGVMSPSWYTDIDSWFDRYKFDEDVMYSLFNHCREHSGLSKHYIGKVADTWASRSIRTSHDLDSYDIEYQKFKDIRSKIVKKLNLARKLTEYEEEYVEKWVTEYGYSFEIIDLALKKTTAKTNPNFKYIHTVLASWHEKGLKSKDEIISFEKASKGPTSKPISKEAVIPQRGNFEQRKYDDKYYDSLYEDVGSDK